MRADLFRPVSILATLFLVAVCTQNRAESTGTAETEVIGYAWPKTDLLITNTTPVAFKRLRNRGKYRLIAKLETGYSIVAPKTDGQEAVAFVPLRDRLGNSIDASTDGEWVTVSCSRVILDTLDWLDLKPGVVPLKTGERYATVKNAGAKLQVQFVSNALTQTVEAAESDVDFLSNAQINKAIETVLSELKTRAERQLADEDYDRDKIDAVFSKYTGRFAEETVKAREELAGEYRFKATQAKREQERKFEEAQLKEEQARQEAEVKYEAEQKAKGLVKYNGEWMTPHEADRRKEEAKREAERREQEAKAQEERRQQLEAEEQARRVRQGREFAEKFRAGLLTKDQLEPILIGKSLAEVKSLLGPPDYSSLEDSGEYSGTGCIAYNHGFFNTLTEKKEDLWILLAHRRVAHIGNSSGGCGREYQ